MKRKVGRAWIECGPATPFGCGLMGETHTTRGGETMPIFNVANAAHKPLHNGEVGDLPMFATPVTIGFYENRRRRDLTSGVE